VHSWVGVEASRRTQATPAYRSPNLFEIPARADNLASKIVKGAWFTACSLSRAQDHFKESVRRPISMIIFDVPYAPVHPGVWSVDASDDDHCEFESRQDAVRFAVRAARTSQQEGRTAFVSIEGIDGHWRLFDHQGKGIV
jgi:hypothetical protein